MILDSSIVEDADHGGAGSDGSANSRACVKAIPHGDAPAGDAACDGSADGRGCDQTGNAPDDANAVATTISARVQVVGQGRAWRVGDCVPSTPQSACAISCGWQRLTPLLMSHQRTPRDDTQTLLDPLCHDMARYCPYCRHRPDHKG